MDLPSYRKMSSVRSLYLWAPFRVSVVARLSATRQFHEYKVCVLSTRENHPHLAAFLLLSDTAPLKSSSLILPPRDLQCSALRNWFFLSLLRLGS
jgi:hypothetical protein